MPANVMDTPHGEGTTSAAVAAGKRRFHTTFRDGAECVEEYDMRTNELVTRRWRQKTVLGADGTWQIEIGEAPSSVAATTAGFGGLSMSASASNPVFCPRESREHWEWRVRNLPYEKSVYSVTVDAEKDELVLRTSNRKYFKRFHVPALRRAGQQLDGEAVSFDHSGTTLIIQYEKPDDIVEAESRVMAARAAQASQEQARDGQPDCKQQ